MSYFGDPRIERVPLTRRRDRLHLKGVKTSASIEPDPFGGHTPPDEWSKALAAAMPVLARTSNAVMVARRAEQRAAARTEMTCDNCAEPMTGGRLRRYCKPSCRQAAYRGRQQA